MMQSRHLAAVFCHCLIMLACAPLVLAAPNITSMSVRGLQIGATTKITIQGSELIPNPMLVASIPIAKQVVLENPAANQIDLEVTLAGDVTPGVYDLRVANEKGISPAVVIAVDRLPQIPLGEKIASLPAAVHGVLNGSSIAKTSFTGVANQQVVVDVEAARIGGKLRPVVHLYNAQRRQIAWSLPHPSLAGDTRLTATLPADGEYTIELHDLQYAAPSPNHFRIKVGSFQYADMVFPPAVERGKAIKIAFVGNVPADKQVELDFRSLQDFGSLGFGSLAPAPWPELALATGLRPALLISDLFELVETPPAEGLQSLPGVPVAVSGRLDAAGQIDKYAIPVTEGAKLRFEVFADRIGSPIDSVLEIKNEQGGQLAVNDDFTGTTDARLDYTVAKDVGVIQVAIRDQVERADARSIYRLVITNPDDTAKQPRFTLFIASDTENIPQGATGLLHVTARRENYDGPIKIQVDRLPAGLTATIPDIAAGSHATLITISGTSDPAAAQQPPSGLGVTRIVGTSVDLNPPISAVAVFDKHPLAAIQPWLRHDMAVALAPANSQAFQIDWSKPESETPLVLGTTFKSPIKFTRPPGAIGPVKLSVVVSEPPPLVNNNPDANRAVRPEQPAVDVAMDANAKAAFDAVAAASKVLADAQTKLQATRAADANAAEAIAAAQTAVQEAEASLAKAAEALRVAEAAIKNDVELNVIVPPNFDAKSCDLAIKAELRSVDNQTVLAQVFTPVRRFAPLNPLGLQLVGEPKLETKLDAATGAAVKLTGTIERKAGFDGDVTVSLDGLPGGVTASNVVLKPDMNAYELELKFPANFAPAEVTSIKLFATGPPDKTKANIVVRAELPITINVLAAAATQN